MSKQALRVGIIGCGNVAQQWHIPALRRAANVEVVALCDSNSMLAQEAACRFHISKWYPDYSDMLISEHLDIVDICTPPTAHIIPSVKAMGAGCHVLVEKPMAMTCDEADDMIEASKKNSVKLCVVHNKLFQQMMLKARSMIDKGSIGNLLGLNLTDGRPGDSEGLINKEHWYHKLRGGVFREDLPHPIYLATSFLGNLEPVAVHSKKLSNHDWLVADEVRIILEGEKGMATITASCNWPKVAASADIFGTKRNLHVDIHSSILTVYGAGGETRSRRALDNLSLSYQQIACTASTILATASRRHYSGHDVLIRKFIESIRDDTEPPVSGREGQEVVRILEKIITKIIANADKDRLTG